MGADEVYVFDACAVALANQEGGTLVTSDHHELDRIAKAEVCQVEFIR